jgi:hypothetical protein
MFDDYMFPNSVALITHKSFIFFPDLLTGVFPLELKTCISSGYFYFYFYISYSTSQCHNVDILFCSFS